MTISRERLDNDLNFIKDNIEKLNKLIELEKNKFLIDFRNIDSSKYLFKSSIETTLEICGYLVEAGGWKTSEDVESTFTILKDKGILNSIDKEEYLNLVVVKDKLNLMAPTLEDEFIFNQLHEKLNLVEKFYNTLKENTK